VGMGPGDATGVPIGNREFARKYSGFRLGACGKWGTELSSRNGLHLT
jgi:hypothetical protein